MRESKKRTSRNGCYIWKELVKKMWLSIMMTVSLTTSQEILCHNLDVGSRSPKVSPFQKLNCAKYHVSITNSFHWEAQKHTLWLWAITGLLWAMWPIFQLQQDYDPNNVPIRFNACLVLECRVTGIKATEISSKNFPPTLRLECDKYQVCTSNSLVLASQNKILQ